MRDLRQGGDRGTFTAFYGGFEPLGDARARVPTPRKLRQKIVDANSLRGSTESEFAVPSALASPCSSATRK